MMTKVASAEDFVALPVNADRFCEGISKIGYQPAAAVMDIVDNSIAAGATQVDIELILNDGVTLNTTGSVKIFRVTDNGQGMRDDQINVALEFGSEVTYPNRSLSKYGFGLKSAGFSLGRRIQVYSKCDGKFSHLKYVDRDVIRARKMYGVCTEPLPDEFRVRLAKTPTGTVVEIANLLPRQDSAAKIRKDLLQRLGITYFHFLTRTENPIRIALTVRETQSFVEPIDILFWSDAYDSFDPDTYDAKSPCKLLDEYIENPAAPDGEKFRLQMVAFPMDKMKGYAGFNDEERAKISSFLVSRENSGFFFYRNGRLIRWGDKIAGVGRDDIIFRTKVSFSTAHDELFHVDVSKQNLAIPEELLERFQLITRIPLGQTKEVATICGKLLGQGGPEPEGAEFNSRTETFAEADAAEEIAPPPQEEKRKRQIQLEQKTKQSEPILKEETAGAAIPDALPELSPAFQRVRYSESIGGIGISVPGFDKNNGTFVRINKNHSYYQLVLANLPPSAPDRQSIEALLFAAAVAEIKTTQNLADVDSNIIDKVFTRFRSVLAQNLDSWVSSNQDLFD